MNQHRSTAWRISIILWASGLLWGCSSDGEQAAELAPPQSIDVTLEGDDPLDPQMELYAQAMSQGAVCDLLDGEANAAAEDFQSSEAALDTSADPPQADPITPVAVETVTDSETEVETAAAETPVEVADAETESVQPLGDGLAIGSPEPPPLTARIETAAREMGAALDEMGQTRMSPLGSMVRLALVDSIHPGAFEAVYGPVEEAAGSAGITADEEELVRATLEIASSLRDELDADFVDTDEVGRMLDAAMIAIRPMRMLEITDAKLCLRVDNFGVYREAERFDGRFKFIPGRPHPVIVYSELDHFTRAPSTRDGVDGYVVNIQQALEIYRIGTPDARDTESTLVWRMDPPPVVDFSRRQLRAFFVVQVIEIPATLSVGSYRMKIVATDIASSEQVERAIDFDMVDGTMLRDRRAGNNGFGVGPFNPDR